MAENPMDPLVEAAAQHLTEGPSFPNALYDILAKGRQFQPSERIQIAAALLYSASRWEGMEPKVRDKLVNYSQVLDRFANEI